MRRTLFTEDHEAFPRTRPRLHRKEVVPAYPQWEKAGRMPREAFEKLGETRIMGITLPEEYGGGGQHDYRYNVVLQEEAARALVTLSTVRTQLEVIPYFLHHANEEQRKRWFLGLAAGTLLTAVAMTEPGTGPDRPGCAPPRSWRAGERRSVRAQRCQDRSSPAACRYDLVVGGAHVDGTRENRRQGLTLLVVEDGNARLYAGRELRSGKAAGHGPSCRSPTFADANRLGRREAFSHGHNWPRSG